MSLRSPVTPVTSQNRQFSILGSLRSRSIHLHRQRFRVTRLRTLLPTLRRHPIFKIPTLVPGMDFLIKFCIILTAS